MSLSLSVTFSENHLCVGAALAVHWRGIPTRPEGERLRDPGYLAQIRSDHRNDRCPFTHQSQLLLLEEDTQVRLHVWLQTGFHFFLVTFVENVSIVFWVARFTATHFLLAMDTVHGSSVGSLDCEIM